MEFDELLITTGVDALVRLVKEKQRIELEDASSNLNIAPETVEDWARVLEEQGIISIEYRLTRIYLVWVKPTEEELVTEAKEFREEKAEIEKEVAEYRKKIAQETSGMEDLRKSFVEFYERAYPRMEKLEKMVAPLPAKGVSKSVFAEYEKELTEVSNELKDITKGLGDIDKELKKLGIEKGKSESKEIIENAEKTAKELRSLEDELIKLRKKTGREEPTEVSMPTIRDIKKKFDSLQKEFASLRAKNVKMREDMISLQESSDILKSVAESIMGHEGKIAGMKKEMNELSKEAEKLLEKTKKLAESAEEHVDMAERLGDSANVAKGILKRFPNQKRVIAELDKIKASEKELGEKYKSLEKVLEAAGGKQVTAKQYAELIKRMDDKVERVRIDLDTLEAALDDEKGTYLTFQKIKDRVVPSIDNYRRKLAEMETRMEAIKKGSAEQKSNIEKDAEKLNEMLKGKQMQGLMKIAEEVRDKKKTIDDIRESLEDLTTMSDNLNKRITLLSREAKLLEIRAGGKAPPAPPTPAEKEKRKEIKRKLELSDEEEAEFRKKREELKKLIRKLWEE